jgi:hypothetical protein
VLYFSFHSGFLITAGANPLNGKYRFSHTPSYPPFTRPNTRPNLVADKPTMPGLLSFARNRSNQQNAAP